MFIRILDGCCQVFRRLGVRVQGVLTARVADTGVLPNDRVARKTIFWDNGSNGIKNISVLAMATIF